MILQYSYALTVTVIFFCSVAINAQSSFTLTNLDDFLNKAEKSIQQYSEIFKNLTAEETKIFEDYGKENKLERVSRIKSVFIVYQSPKNGEVNEFRNVLEFNGRKVALPDTEVQKLFEGLQGENSVAKEWDKIIAEGTRYDGKSTAWGMTLWQDAPLGKLKPFFEFNIVGKERNADRDVLVIEYEQTKPTLLIKINPTKSDWKKEPLGREYYVSVPSALRPLSPRIVGKIWLDAETAQIWRNEFKVFLRPARLTQPVVVLEVVYQYEASEFKILVPKKFNYTFYKISGSSDKNLTIAKERLLQFEYSRFKEFKSEAKDYKTITN